MNPNDIQQNQLPQTGKQMSQEYNNGASLQPNQNPTNTNEHNVNAHPVEPPKSNKNSTQNTLQISEIRDGVVIMNDGSFRSVAMVKSINFDLMSPTEREGVEYAYQSFLNSLYFEIQIFVHSSKVDIRPYLEKLNKIRSEQDNMLLGVLMDDYLDYMANLAEQTNIMDKKFYIVIPYYSNLNNQKLAQASKGFMTTIFGQKENVVTINEQALETAKTELKNRLETVLAGLAQSGVQGMALDTQELIELYYDSYNPDTATRQPLKNFNDLTAPVVSKGVGMASQPNLDKEIQ